MLVTLGLVLNYDKVATKLIEEAYIEDCSIKNRSPFPINFDVAVHF